MNVGDIGFAILFIALGIGLVCCVIGGVRAPAYGDVRARVYQDPTGTWHAVSEVNEGDKISAWWRVKDHTQHQSEEQAVAAAMGHKHRQSIIQQQRDTAARFERTTGREV